MKKTKADYEAYVRELRARGPEDRDALAALCQVLWALQKHDDARVTFRTLLNLQAAPGDAEFDEVYLAGLATTNTCPTPMRRRYRLMNLVELLQNTADVQGEVVECGCFRGMSSYVLCSYLRRASPKFDGAGYHIFDSFQGLSEPTLDDEIPDGWDNAVGLERMSQRGSFAASAEEVRQNLRDFPRIIYHQGWIPLTFQSLKETRYRFVHVDVDLYDPTLDAFRYFYPRLAPGGIIVSDDYSWPGAQTATHEFVTEAGIELEISPHKQAVLRKPV